MDVGEAKFAMAEAQPRRRGACARATSHRENEERDLRDPHKVTCALCGCVATQQRLSSASFSSLQSLLFHCVNVRQALYGELHM